MLHSPQFNLTLLILRDCTISYYLFRYVKYAFEPKRNTKKFSFFRRTVKTIKIGSLRDRTLAICLLISTLFCCSHGKNNIDLINELKKNGVIKTASVARAMTVIDRKNYCPNISYPYDDIPQKIGHSATISSPHMHALGLELLKDHLVKGQTALDVGSGSGYMTVCMAVMLGEQGKAVGVEHVPELVVDATNNVQNTTPWLLTTHRVKFYHGDGRLGFAKHAPYNAIYIGATITEVPHKIIEQLKHGGRIVAPIESHSEKYLSIVDKGMDGRVRTIKRIGSKYILLSEKKELFGYLSD